MNIKIHHRITDDRRKLILSIDRHNADKLIVEMCESPDHKSDRFMHDVFEHLVCNSELQWIDPSETGDLTEAPMLGIRDEDGKVIERWAYMDYMIHAPISILLDERELVFTS